MPEELVVRQCAPTLAGLKTGSLFRAACTDKKALLAQIRDLNQRLREKGLCLIPLRFRDGNALLYLYRPARLKIDLKNELARRTLGNAGYLDESPERCIVNLIRRFQGDEFPHEIGLFLSYPPEDVQGFIENHASKLRIATVPLPLAPGPGMVPPQARPLHTGQAWQKPIWPFAACKTSV